MSEEELVRHYGPMVYKIAFSATKNAFDADDIYAQTFLAYFKKKRAFESEEHRKAWLIKVAVNCVKAHMRERGCHEDLDEYAGQISAEDSYQDMDVKTAIESLDSLSRQLIYLYYYEERSVKQLAELFAYNENTVKTKLARARERLRQLLGDPKSVTK